MGLETAGLLMMGAGALGGAVSGDRASARNTRAAQQHQQRIQGMVAPYLTGPGAQNPFSEAIQSFLSNGMYRAPALGAQSYDPSLVATPPGVGTSAFNPGQDALLQFMRASPALQRETGLDSAMGDILSGGTPFATDDLIASLNDLDAIGLNEQIGALKGSAGTLGQRFGSAMGRNEALLRSNFLSQQAARNAGLRQQSHEAAQGRRLQGAGIAAGRENVFNNLLTNIFGQQIGAASAAGGLAQAGRETTSREEQFNAGNAFQALLANAAAQNAAGQFNAGQRTQADMFNVGQGNTFNNFMLQALASAGGLQAGNNAQNAQLLAIMAGLAPPPVAPSALPGAVGELGQLAFMLPFLRGMTGGGTGQRFAAPNIPAGYGPGYGFDPFAFVPRY